MKTLGLVLALVLVGCAEAPHRLDVGPEFIEHVLEFQIESGHYLQTPVLIDNLVVRFGPMHYGAAPDVVGYCAYRGGETPVITIRHDKWVTYSHVMREELMFHELGHCILDRSHDSRTMVLEGQWTELSLMNPTMVNEYYYDAHRDYYLRQLFIGN